MHLQTARGACQRHPWTSVANSVREGLPNGACGDVSPNDVLTFQQETCQTSASVSREKARQAKPKYQLESGDATIVCDSSTKSCGSKLNDHTARCRSRESTEPNNAWWCLFSRRKLKVACVGDAPHTVRNHRKTS